MRDLTEITKANGSTQADIEGGSFFVRDGIRIPIFAGVTGAQIDAAERLEYLRGELRAEGISVSELLELQSLVQYIEPGDVELLEAAGVPEHN